MFFRKAMFFLLDFPENTASARDISQCRCKSWKSGRSDPLFPMQESMDLSCQRGADPGDLCKQFGTGRQYVLEAAQMSEHGPSS